MLEDKVLKCLLLLSPRFLKKIRDIVRQYNLIDRKEYVSRWYMPGEKNNHPQLYAISIPAGKFKEALSKQKPMEIWATDYYRYDEGTTGEVFFFLGKRLILRTEGWLWKYGEEGILDHNYRRSRGTESEFHHTFVSWKLVRKSVV